MPLNINQIRILEESILGYRFPREYRNFTTNDVVVADSMVQVERTIRTMLISPDLDEIKNGLANVIFWGNAQAGYRDYRVNRFRSSVTKQQIEGFQIMLKGFPDPSIRQIKDLGLPGFSGISFISKIVAFLNPDDYCVLDLQLVRLSAPSCNKPLARVRYTTQISPTIANCAAYLGWCEECSETSRKYYKSRYRVVDVERGFFNLIQTDRLIIAQEIYRDS